MHQIFINGSGLTADLTTVMTCRADRDHCSIWFQVDLLNVCSVLDMEDGPMLRLRTDSVSEHLQDASARIVSVVAVGSIRPFRIPPCLRNRRQQNRGIN